MHVQEILFSCWKGASPLIAIPLKQCLGTRNLVKESGEKDDTDDTDPDCD